MALRNPPPYSPCGSGCWWHSARCPGLTSISGGSLTSHVTQLLCRPSAHGTRWPEAGLLWRWLPVDRLDCMCHYACVDTARQWFRAHRVLGALLVGVATGPLIAAAYYYFREWWFTRNAHPMLLYTGPGYLNVMIVGAVVGLVLGITVGFLYKCYAKKP